MAGAKSSSHVPKFGNWDTDDVPYTICFQNASELRAAGVTFDPNDPDTYPPEVLKAAISPPVAAANDHKSIPGEQRRAIASSGSEKLSSERSSSDYSLLKEAKQSGRKKKSGNDYNGVEVEGISRFPPPVVRRNKEGEMIASSVPKFGSWDARDPKSGDGYTAIFNKVKIEKQIAASNLQTVPPLMNQTKQPVAHATNTHGFTSFASKMDRLVYVFSASLEDALDMFSLCTSKQNRSFARSKTDDLYTFEKTILLDEGRLLKRRPSSADMLLFMSKVKHIITTPRLKTVHVFC